MKPARLSMQDLRPYQRCPRMGGSTSELDSSVTFRRPWLLNQRIGRVGCQNPPAGDVNHVFVLEPEESEVVYALREIGFDDDVAGNHAARNEGVVGTVVSVGLQLRNRPDGGHIRRARYRMRAQHVVGGAEGVVRANDLRECFVQKIHPDAEIGYGDRIAPSAQARRYTERSGRKFGVQLNHIRSDSLFELLLEVRVHVGQGAHGRPTSEPESLSN